MAFQTRILFEEPNKDGGYSYYGASPKFIAFLKNFLIKNDEKIASVKMAIYLFNNFELHKTFTRLAEAGVKIEVTSIPLEGYDSRSPQSILPSDDGFSFSEKQTKESLAKAVYNSFLKNENPNYRLNIFPHTYIRSPKINPFSRGAIPYSLHTKSLFIEMKDGTNLLGITSSNLAMRDLPKHDYFLMKEATADESEVTRHFFTQLAANSITVMEFQSKTDNFDVEIKSSNLHPQSDTFFMAPFYANSPEKAEIIISDIFRGAKKRIWLITQHLSSFNYPVPLQFRIKNQTSAIQKREGCLSVLLKKAAEGLDVRCMSQTFADENISENQFRVPANTYNFKQFIKAFRKNSNSHYKVNEHIHSKYIIADDVVLATTFNYTPTQFISLPFVNIPKFEKIPGLKYKGIFSEVGQLLRITRKQEVGCFLKNFEYVWTHPDTVLTI